MSKIYLHYEGSKGAAYTTKMVGTSGSKFSLDEIVLRFSQQYNQKESSSSSSSPASDKLEPACLELCDMHGFRLSKLGPSLDACLLFLNDATSSATDLMVVDCARRELAQPAEKKTKVATAAAPVAAQAAKPQQAGSSNLALNAAAGGCLSLGGDCSAGLGWNRALSDSFRSPGLALSAILFSVPYHTLPNHIHTNNDISMTRTIHVNAAAGKAEAAKAVKQAKQMFLGKAMRRAREIVQECMSNKEFNKSGYVLLSCWYSCWLVRLWNYGRRGL